MSDGLKLKYHITKADGRPATGRYFILKLDSKNPAHAEASKRAVIAYAHSIATTLPELSSDILGAILEHGRTGTWNEWDDCIGGKP